MFHQVHQFLGGPYWPQTEAKYQYCVPVQCTISSLNTFSRRYYDIVLRLYVCNVCIVAKTCALEQTLLLTAYGKSHIGNRLVPK